MPIENLEIDPYLERNLLDTLAYLVEKSHGEGSLYEIFCSDGNLSERLYNKLYSGGKSSLPVGKIIPEINIPLNKTSLIKRFYLEPKAESPEYRRLIALEIAYMTRLSEKDGRGKNDLSTPKSWSIDSKRKWKILLEDHSFQESDLKDFNLSLDLAHRAIDLLSISNGPMQAKANARVFADALKNLREKFPQDDNLYYQLLAFVCARGVYQSFVTEDLRYICVFKNRLKEIRSRCNDSIPEIGYQMSLFYYDRIIGGQKSHLQGLSPCTVIMDTLISSPPHIYTMNKWDHHTFNRHLNDEFLAKGTRVLDHIPSRPGVPLIKSLSQVVDLTKTTGCEECGVGTRLSYAIGLAKQGETLEALNLATLALDASLLSTKANLKTKARAYEVKGCIENIINPGQGNANIQVAIDKYLQIKALFAASHAQKLLNPL